MTATNPRPHPGYERDSRGYRRIVVALFAAGVATFAQLYSTQAVLPALAGAMRVDAAHTALTVSCATGALAVSVLAWSVLADRVGRVPVMVASVVLATLLGLAMPWAGTISTLLVLRTLQGAALGGLPAVAMAYLAEEVSPRQVAQAAAVYVAGTSLGGMSGRILSSIAVDLVGSWRAGVLAVALVGAVATAVFCVAVPRARGFSAPGLHSPRGRGTKPVDGEKLRRKLRTALADRGLLALYAQALLLMGAFVTVYNYLGFRLLDRPFSLSQTVVGLLFVVYLAGTLSSSVAGRLVRRGSRFSVLAGSGTVFAIGCLLTLAPALPVVLLGLVLLTAGFFAAHAVASGWVGSRAPAGVRAQATALYTFAYYAGSSVIGWLGGKAFDGAGWPAVVAVGAGLGFVAVAVAALVLRRDGAAGSMRA